MRAADHHAVKARASAKRADIHVENHGSLFLLHMETNAAREWIADNVSSEYQVWCGAIVVEPRYVQDIVAGAREAGLEVR